MDLVFDCWNHSFKSAIRNFVCRSHGDSAAPWQDPVPLQRDGWCLFEIYSTIVKQSKFEVTMTQNSSKEAFLKDIISEPVNSVNNKMLATIDVAKSECFKPEDIERIFEIVRREVGVVNINLYTCSIVWPNSI